MPGASYQILSKELEKEIVTGLKSGNMDALETVYRQFGEKIFNQSYRILLSQEAAEDILHDIFVSLRKRILTYRGEASLGTWLYRVTHNLCLERIRSWGNRRRLLQEKYKHTPLSNENDLEKKDLLNQALKTLDPETRSLMWLKEGESMEIKELSRIFGKPEGTIKSRLSRGREKLQHWIEKESVYAT